MSVFKGGVRAPGMERRQRKGVCNEVPSVWRYHGLREVL